MASRQLTTTSYAVLGLLSIRPWSTYELTQQMERSLAHIWPRATSKIYEEPKKLVAHGLARAKEDAVGRRARTVYAITPKGRRALRGWLSEPGAGPVLEFEQLLQVFFSDGGSRDDTLATLDAAIAWARERSEVSATIGRDYLEGAGLFPDRAPQHVLTAAFLNELYALVDRWASWAGAIVAQWPDDPRTAEIDPAVFEHVAAVAAETLREPRSEAVSPAGGSPPARARRTRPG